MVETIPIFMGVWTQNKEGGGGGLALHLISMSICFKHILFTYILFITEFVLLLLLLLSVTFIVNP